MWIDSRQDVKVSTYQLIDANGKATGALRNHTSLFVDLTDDKMLDMYRCMLFARLFDERAIRLQRQGRIGTYAPYSGQEAATVGSAFALEPQDWIFPTYRDLPAAWVRGLPLQQSLLYFMGNVRGGFIPEGVNSFPVQIIIAAQALHAMGSAWASKYLNDGAASVCYLGDGATSQGDFHEAMNFASVYQLPAVFFIQNNQWAISVPGNRQSGSRTLAQRALAYDIPGIQVDGNDVLAVFQVMRQAVAKARHGEGPVLIEALTYRQGPHTTSDDPTRYRNREEVEQWLIKDPISRFYAFLNKRGLIDEEKDREIRTVAAETIEQAVVEAEAAPKGTLPDAMDLVYTELPPLLRKQRDEAAAFLARTTDGIGE